MTPETSDSGGIEEENTGEAMPPMQMGEAVSQAPEAEVTTPAQPQAEGRRTQLRIVRENIQSLSRDVGNFRRSHEAYTKRLEKQIASLRNELAIHARARGVKDRSKTHETTTKKLEKQVATLRSELAGLKRDIARDLAKSRAKQEAVLSKVLAKVSIRSSKPAKGTKKR